MSPYLGETKEECKFGDYRFKGYPISLQQAVDYIPKLTAVSALVKGNTIQFFESEIKARDFYWQLVEWLDS